MSFVLALHDYTALFLMSLILMEKVRPLMKTFWSRT